MGTLVNLAGERFGRLSVESRHDTRKGKIYWNCACDCGANPIVQGGNLKSGVAQSCGCLNREVASKGATVRNLRHGHNFSGKQTLTHSSWSAMLKRCRNPNNKNYPNYGGRGITVTQAWHTFENFLRDMGERPEDKTLDRINVNGNYEPANCRWATLSEQQRNKRCHA